mmetsp:Transcript_14409/g.36252  ORF Transcript_14409/g.36252 Transcript_14409/m.36252 type:complete len:263 (-) Transcript_14409:7-795(-)
MVVVEGHLATSLAIAVGDRHVGTIPEFLGRRRLGGARVRRHVVPPQHGTARLDARWDRIAHTVLVRHQVALPLQYLASISPGYPLACLTLQQGLPPTPALVAILAAVLRVRLAAALAALLQKPVHHEAGLRQQPSICAELELEKAHMVRSHHDLELNCAPGNIRGLHVPDLVVRLRCACSIAADAVLVLRVAVAKAVHRTRAASDGAVVVEVPRRGLSHATVAMCHAKHGRRKQKSMHRTCTHHRCRQEAQEKQGAPEARRA